MKFLCWIIRGLPTIYLGPPWGAPHKSCIMWDVLEVRFGRRLAFWKKWYFSKGGRLVPIKSTFFNMPIYFMSLFTIPKKVRIRLENV